MSEGIRSGDKARCLHCKYEGYVYGTPYSGGRNHGAGVSAPWCPKCEINDQLEKLKTEQVK